MFKTRLLSGIVLVIIAFATIFLGGDVLFATLLIISLIGVSELYKVVKIEKAPLGIVGYIGVVAYYFLIRAQKKEDLMMFAIILLILVMAVYVFAFPKYVSEQVMTAYFGVFYVAIMLSYIYQTRLLKDGLFLVGLVFLCSWGCDTCAYCVGVLIGKHKMAPKLSPKKSIEGGIGGLAGAALLGALYALAINTMNPKSKIASTIPICYLLLLILSYVSCSVSRICSTVGFAIVLCAFMQSSIISVISRYLISRFRNWLTASSFAALNTVGSVPPHRPAS
jgi:phosphatidate cytidylyltransferase